MPVYDEGIKYSHKLYDMLPTLARHIDGRHGNYALQHLCEAADVPLYEVLWFLQHQDRFYDLDNPASHPYLDWLGQFVGLSRYGTHWVGIGLNPQWPPETKITAIRAAWAYWQAKGSRWGIKEATRIWLQWDGHNPNRFELEEPIGTHPTAHPPRWFDYATPYDYNALLTYQESKHRGSGDYAQLDRHRYGFIETPFSWAYGADYGENLASTVAQAPETRFAGSRQWIRQHWQHFWLDNTDADTAEAEWRRIVADAPRLSQESTPAHIGKTHWFWWERAQPTPITLSRRPAQDDDPPETEIRWEADGFKYWDLWPTRASGPTEIETTVIQQVTFSGCLIPECFEYAEGWALPGGLPLERPVIGQQTETIPGVALGECAEYGRSYPGTATETTVTTETVVYPGNYDSCVLWGLLDGYQRDWLQIASTTTRTVSSGSTLQIGSLPWYSAGRTATTVVYDPDAPTETEATGVACWYAEPWDYEIEVTQTAVLPGYPCYPGFEIDLVVGYEETVAPGTPDQPNQRWVITPATTETEVTPAIPGNGANCADYADPWPTASPPTISFAPQLTALDALEPLPLLGAITTTLLEVSNSYRYYHDGGLRAVSIEDCWYFAEQPSRIAPVELPNRYALEMPQEIALWGGVFSWANAWYSVFSGVPEQTQLTPVTQLGRVCNCRDDWTKYKIEWFEIIQLPPTAENLNDLYPKLQAFNNRSSWRLYVQTTEQTIVIPEPPTLFWVDPENPANRETRALSYTAETPALLIEFVIQPLLNSDLLSVSLFHGATLINHRDFVGGVPFDSRSCFGFRWVLPVVLEAAIV